LIIVENGTADYWLIWALYDQTVNRDYCPLIETYVALEKGTMRLGLVK